MALQIVEKCTNCWACLPLCPTQAIYKAKPHFLIDQKKCTECEGHFADPQCANICPIEEAIVNQFGISSNPLGSLTGIPPEKLASVRAEIQAR